MLGTARELKDNASSVVLVLIDPVTLASTSIYAVPAGTFVNSATAGWVDGSSSAGAPHGAYMTLMQPQGEAGIHLFKAVLGAPGAPVTSTSVTPLQLTATIGSGVFMSAGPAKGAICGIDEDGNPGGPYVAVSAVARAVASARDGAVDRAAVIVLRTMILPSSASRQRWTARKSAETSPRKSASARITTCRGAARWRWHTIQDPTRQVRTMLLLLVLLPVLLLVLLLLSLLILVLQGGGFFVVLAKKDRTPAQGAEITLFSCKLFQARPAPCPPAPAPCPPYPHSPRTIK